METFLDRELRNQTERLMRRKGCLLNAVSRRENLTVEHEQALGDYFDERESELRSEISVLESLVTHLTWLQHKESAAETEQALTDSPF